jgi:hypothetical protein
MQKELTIYLDKIRADYGCFQGTNTGDSVRDQIRDNMKKEFAQSLEVKEGKKFIKITKKNYGVHSFIVKEDFVSSNGVQFRKGDILKAAGYNMPAQNAARGNIFGNYIVRWTGALYMDAHGRLLN